MAVAHKGFVWIGGREGSNAGDDDMILKFTKAGKFVMQIGHRGQSKGNKDPNNMSSPSDLTGFPPGSY